MTILTLLHDILGPSLQQKDEYLFRCPFCHHHKKKLSINITSNKWKCWVCDAKGARIISLLKRMNAPRDVIKKFKEVLGETDVSKYAAVEQNTDIQLPAEYHPLWKVQKSYPYLHAISYLKDRGITSEEIFRYRMGYCESGTYAGRIIVPSYDKDNKLNYFTARSFYEGSIKYKNPPVSKNVVIFENLIDWDEPVILCEGMFDAIALRRNAIPLMGKTISKNLEHALLRHSVEHVIIFLDVDARMDALKLEHHLKQYDIDTRLVLTEGKDASEMGFETSWQSIHQSHTTNFKDFIQQRLYA